MKNYTLIYVDSWMSGSHMVRCEKVVRVSAATIEDVMNSKYGEMISFIFEGHPKMEGEENLYDVYPPVIL